MHNRFLRVLILINLVSSFWEKEYVVGFLDVFCWFLETFPASSGNLQHDCLRGRAHAGDLGAGERSET